MVCGKGLGWRLQSPRNRGFYSPSLKTISEVWGPPLTSHGDTALGGGFLYICSRDLEKKKVRKQLLQMI